MLNKQRKVEGEALVTTIIFNHQYDILHNRINVRGISPITEADYEVSVTTALLNAIGFSIQKTDGMENASREYTPNKI